MSSAAHPPRVVGIYRRGDLPPWEARDATLALWRLADPGNVGTLIRTADAFGAGVVLSDGCADPTAPKALRASAGSIWRVPLGSWDDVRGRRVALEAHGGEPLAFLDLSGQVTFLLGAEREGLPADVSRDLVATIPIVGAESLNVAACGAIAPTRSHGAERRRRPWCLTPLGVRHRLGRPACAGRPRPSPRPPRQGERSNQP